VGVGVGIFAEIENEPREPSRHIDLHVDAQRIGAGPNRKRPRKDDAQEESGQFPAVCRQ
jgi:hypothetical protein